MLPYASLGGSNLKPSIAVHGGAGSGKYPEGDRRFKGLKAALQEGLSALKKGSSLDGVVAAVEYMEGSGAFNAGKGACLDIEGKISLDAAVMTGEGLRGCGVGSSSGTYHPVRLAHWLMENTPHVLIVGEACSGYARSARMRVHELVPADSALIKYRKLVREGRGLQGRRAESRRGIRGGGTVGAVAMDSDGVPAAAVSTGGMWLKLPGRVGDSAVIGAGVYADSSGGAACATGVGEEIIRNSLCREACRYLTTSGAQQSADRAISLITMTSGSDTAGIITVDLRGRVGFAYNTEAMGRAWLDADNGRIHVQN
ncbi:MAG: isoaspartyl peptidase/L-asparaginase [Thaumarchaeota archaeon]|nr:isoaspartyl peptidase/L-asparaginase [Nitrososphaerota archaeon]